MDFNFIIIFDYDFPYSYPLVYYSNDNKIEINYNKKQQMIIDDYDDSELNLNLHSKSSNGSSISNSHGFVELKFLNNASWSPVVTINSIVFSVYFHLKSIVENSKNKEFIENFSKYNNLSSNSITGQIINKEINDSTFYNENILLYSNFSEDEELKFFKKCCNIKSFINKLTPLTNTIDYKLNSKFSSSNFLELVSVNVENISKYDSISYHNKFQYTIENLRSILTWNNTLVEINNAVKELDLLKKSKKKFLSENVTEKEKDENKVLTEFNNLLINQAKDGAHGMKKIEIEIENENEQWDNSTFHNSSCTKFTFMNSSKKSGLGKLKVNSIINQEKNEMKYEAEEMIKKYFK